MATYTLHDYADYTHGTNYGMAGSSVQQGVAGFGISTAFGGSGKQGSDPYISVIPNGVFTQGVYTKVVSNPSTGWVSVGCYIDSDTLPTASGDKNLIFVGKFVAGTGISYTHWVMNYNKNGNITIVDANGTTIATATSKIVADQWYRFVATFQFSNSTAMKVWWGPETGTQELIFDLSGFDAKNTGGTDVQLILRDGRPGSEFAGAYAVNQFIMTHDGANWDTSLTGAISNIVMMGDTSDVATAGDWTVLGPYRSAKASRTADVGSVTTSGFWSDAENIGGDDTTQTIYKTSRFSHPTKSGYVWSDDATIGGPKGDSNVDNAIVGAKWVGRLKADAQTGKPQPALVYGRREGTTDTVATSPLQGVSSYTNISYVEGGATDVEVPTSTGYIALGHKHDTTPGNAGQTYMAEMFGTILHAETPPPATPTTSLFMLNGIGSQVTA